MPWQGHWLRQFSVLARITERILIRKRMPTLLTYTELRILGDRPDARAFFQKAPDLQGKNVFLSHTTKDDDLVPGVVLVLGNHGGRVYVDHQDPSVEGADCRAIAEHLREVMRQCKRLVVLASPRSMDSKWIPWELGLGDGLERQSHVALFPSAESATDTAWSEREYFGLYQRIGWGRIEGRSEPCWVVWDHTKNTGETLVGWLLQAQ